MHPLKENYELLKNEKSGRLPYQLIQNLADQVRNPLQLILELIKCQIDLFEVHQQLNERDESTKQILNTEDCDPL